MNGAPNSVSGNPTSRNRKVIVVSILLVIALIHLFRAGTYLQCRLYMLYYSYFSDVIVPFGFYFLLCLNDIRYHFLSDWRVRAALVFAVASSTEVMQAFGVPLLGQTFDPLDFVMFAGGVLLAAFVDRCVFERFVPGWSSKVYARNL